MTKKSECDDGDADVEDVHHYQEQERQEEQRRREVLGRKDYFALERGLA